MPKGLSGPDSRCDWPEDSRAKAAAAVQHETADWDEPGSFGPPSVETPRAGASVAGCRDRKKIGACRRPAGASSRKPMRPRPGPACKVPSDHVVVKDTGGVSDLKPSEPNRWIQDRENSPIVLGVGHLPRFDSSPQKTTGRPGPGVFPNCLRGQSLVTDISRRIDISRYPAEIRYWKPSTNWPGQLFLFVVVVGKGRMEGRVGADGRRSRRTALFSLLASTDPGARAHRFGVSGVRRLGGGNSVQGRSWPSSAPAD